MYGMESQGCNRGFRCFANDWRGLLYRPFTIDTCERRGRSSKRKANNRLVCVAHGLLRRPDLGAQFWSASHSASRRLCTEAMTPLAYTRPVCPPHFQRLERAQMRRTNRGTAKNSHFAIAMRLNRLKSWGSPFPRPPAKYTASLASYLASEYLTARITSAVILVCKNT
jgi:hypothetical protein